MRRPVKEPGPVVTAMRVEIGIDDAVARQQLGDGGKDRSAWPVGMSSTRMSTASPRNSASCSRGAAVSMARSVVIGGDVGERGWGQAEPSDAVNHRSFPRKREMTEPSGDAT